MCWTLFLLFWWSISLWQDQINTWIIVTPHVVLQTENLSRAVFTVVIQEVSLNSKRKKNQLFFFSPTPRSHDSEDHAFTLSGSWFNLIRGSFVQCWPVSSWYCKILLLSSTFLLGVSVSCFFFVFFLNPTERKCHFFHWMNLKPTRFWRQKLFHLPKLFFKCWLKATFTRCSIFASSFLNAHICWEESEPRDFIPHFSW